MGYSFQYNLTDQRFGSLLAGNKKVNYVTGVNYKGGEWHCECDCGNLLYVRQVDLLRGNVSDCGCVKKERDFKRLLMQRHKQLSST